MKLSTLRQHRASVTWLRFRLAAAQCSASTAGKHGRLQLAVCRKRKHCASDAARARQLIFKRMCRWCQLLRFCMSLSIGSPECPSDQVQARVTVTVVSVSKAWTGLGRELANLDCSAQLLQCSRAQHSCCRYIDSLQLVACTTKTTSLIAHT